MQKVCRLIVKGVGCLFCNNTKSGMLQQAGFQDFCKNVFIKTLRVSVLEGKGQALFLYILYKMLFVVV